MSKTEFFSVVSGAISVIAIALSISMWLILPHKNEQTTTKSIATQPSQIAGVENRAIDNDALIRALILSNEFEDLLTKILQEEKSFDRTIKQGVNEAILDHLLHEENLLGKEALQTLLAKAIRPAEYQPVDVSRIPDMGSKIATIMEAFSGYTSTSSKKEL